METMISDIQKFSLHDGPGIRTTVFFKGCNMHCMWCHNPETFFKKRELLFYSSRCIGCGACYRVCKTGALKKEERRIYNKSLCTGCGACAEACAPGALQIAGRKMSVEEIMAVVRTDMDYYRASGGGVTLSGGEVLMQPDFAAELLKACKEEGISTAMETNLSGPFENIRKLMPYLDRIYCDIKILNDSEHIRYTGISNQSTLDNLKKLYGSGIPLIIRTPLIPGITDSPENISGISRWVKEYTDAEAYELLNYNPLAEAKAEELGNEYILGTLTRKNKAQMEALLAVARESGIPVIAGGE